MHFLISLSFAHDRSRNQSIPSPANWLQIKLVDWKNETQKGPAIVIGEVFSVITSHRDIDAFTRSVLIYIFVSKYTIMYSIDQLIIQAAKGAFHKLSTNTNNQETQHENSWTINFVHL